MFIKLPAAHLHKAKNLQPLQRVRSVYALSEGNHVCAYACTICMCVFQLVTETHISATTKRLGYQGALLIAPFYYLNQPLAHNTFITQMVQKQHNQILHRACSIHLLNIQSTLQPKPAFCLNSTEESILTLQCDDRSHVETQISVFNTFLSPCDT